MAAAGRLLIETERQPDLRVLTLYGTLDAAGASLLLRELLNEPPGRTKLDLTGVEQIDTPGMRMLLAAQRGALVAGHELFVRLSPAHVDQVLEASRAG